MKHETLIRINHNTFVLTSEDTCDPVIAWLQEATAITKVRFEMTESVVEQGTFRLRQQPDGSVDVTIHKARITKLERSGDAEKDLAESDLAKLEALASPWGNEEHLDACQSLAELLTPAKLMRLIDEVRRRRALMGER